MKTNLLTLAIALGLAGCAGNLDSGRATEQWSNYRTTDISEETAKLNNEQALAVFYRKDSIDGPNVNVYVNGDYQASLMPNSITPVAVCAADVQLHAAFINNETFGNNKKSFVVALPVSEVTYLEVIQTAEGELAFRPVEEEIALQELDPSLTMNNTSSRASAAATCGGNVVIDNVTVNTEALFNFNKYRYADILPEGKNHIEAFVAQLASVENAKNIVVKGYTDPTGDAGYNQILSQRRANSVKKALINAGVTMPIDTQGYGEENLIVNDCATRYGWATPELKACNQPNRRVEITLYGE